MLEAARCLFPLDVCVVGSIVGPGQERTRGLTDVADLLGVLPRGVSGVGVGLDAVTPRLLLRLRFFSHPKLFACFRYCGQCAGVPWVRGTLKVPFQSSDSEALARSFSRSDCVLALAKVGRISYPMAVSPVMPLSEVALFMCVGGKALSMRQYVFLLWRRITPSVFLIFLASGPIPPRSPPVSGLPSGDRPVKAQKSTASSMFVTCPVCHSRWRIQSR